MRFPFNPTIEQCRTSRDAQDKTEPGDPVGLFIVPCPPDGRELTVEVHGRVSYDGPPLFEQYAYVFSGDRDNRPTPEECAWLKGEFFRDDERLVITDRQTRILRRVFGYVAEGDPLIRPPIGQSFTPSDVAWFEALRSLVHGRPPIFFSGFAGNVEAGAIRPFPWTGLGPAGGL